MGAAPCAVTFCTASFRSSSFRPAYCRCWRHGCLAGGCDLELSRATHHVSRRLLTPREQASHRTQLTLSRLPCAHTHTQSHSVRESLRLLLRLLEIFGIVG